MFRKMQISIYATAVSKKKTADQEFPYLLNAVNKDVD